MTVDIPFVNKLVRLDKTVRLLVCVTIGRRTNRARCDDCAVLDLEYFWHAYFDDRDIEVTIVKLLVRRLV